MDNAKKWWNLSDRLLDARLGVGEVGEIMARTPTVMKTFINRLKQIYFKYRHNSFVGWAAIPPTWFGSAVCIDMYIHITYIVLQSAGPNHFGATAGIKVCFFYFSSFLFLWFWLFGQWLTELNSVVMVDLVDFFSL